LGTRLYNTEVWQPRGYKGQGFQKDGNYQRNYDGQKGKGSRYGRRGKSFRGGTGVPGGNGAATGGGFGEEGKTGRRHPRTKGGRGTAPSGTATKNENGRRSNNIALSMVPSQWPPLPSLERGEATNSAGNEGESVISDGTNDVKPAWDNGSINTLENNAAHSELEILKAVPCDVKVTEAKMYKSDKKEGKENQHVAVRSKSNGQKDTEVNDAKTDEKSVAALGPALGWPSISSSSVKKPPTNTQVEKHKVIQPKLPQPKQTPHVMEHVQKTNAPAIAPSKAGKLKSGKPSKTTLSPKPANAQNNKQSKSDQQLVPIPAEAVVTPPKPTGPSYADIARSSSPPLQQVQQQAPQSTQQSQMEQHVKSD